MLLDLAADSRQTVPADLPDYIRQHDIVRAALRVAKEVDATDEEWKAFIVSTGRLKRIHEADQVLVLADGLRIPIGDIVELESECIRGLL